MCCNKETQLSENLYQRLTLRYLLNRGFLVICFWQRRHQSFVISGLQFLCPKITCISARPVSTVTSARLPRAGAAERMHDHRRAPDAGSRCSSEVNKQKPPLTPKHSSVKPVKA